MNLVESVRAELARTGETATASSVSAAVRRQGGLLGNEELARVAEQVRHELVGAGPLQPLLMQPGVTDVLVNGPSDVWVDRGAGLVRSTVTFGGESSVRALAQRLATGAGRRLDEAQPWVDAQLANGVRLHAVLPPISGSHTLISLRVPAAHAFDLDDLVQVNALPRWGVGWLQRLVCSRASFLVTGGTGTGKTTILASLLSLVGPTERLLIVEDSAELNPQAGHVVRLQSRPPNVEGAGAVTLSDLVRQALRMRPDRLVVGEVRGAEIVDLLAALNTGHEGGCGTVHANAATELPARLEALALAAGMPRVALHSQLAAGLSLVLHLGRRDGLRVVDELAVTTRVGEYVRVEPALRFSDASYRGPGYARLCNLLGEP